MLGEVHRKTKHPFELYTWFGYGCKMGVVRILEFFQGRLTFSYINGKLLPRRFEIYGYIGLYRKKKNRFYHNII